MLLYMLILTTALLAEAKPLIQHFSLKKIFNDTPFPVFRKENIYLIISGIGKEKMLIALGYLLGFLNERVSFLNIGLAGHASWELGQAALISKIEDEQTKEVFYPTFLKQYSLPYSSLITVSSWEKNFAKASLYDMEGSAFFKAASHFTTSEFIHSIKIVSDTACLSFQKERASELVEKNLHFIEEVVCSLQELLLKLPPAMNILPLLEEVHFTETQRHQLKHILHKLKLYSSDEILQFLKEHVSSSIH